MQSELEVLAKTDHPHIVRTKELLEDENNFYIVSELVKGGELYQKILEKRKFNEKDSAEYVKQIALALNYMHVQNIMHRDIKPENILIQEQEDGKLVLKLTDFGFA